MVKKYIWNVQFGGWTKGLRSQEGVTILEVPTPKGCSDYGPLLTFSGLDPPDFKLDPNSWETCELRFGEVSY
jgi:hypothetical protein